MLSIPEADFALIGGSSTQSLDLPIDSGLDFVELVKEGMVFATPYGNSPEFKLIKIHGLDKKIKRVLHCKMHGWRRGVSRAAASRQIFWVFREAGVKKILAEGGVGAINHLLNTWDIVIPHDYIDFSMRKDVGLDDRYLLVMRDSMCQEMRELLYKICCESWPGRAFERSVYVNTDGRHFESPSEVSMFKNSGGDVVGQSLCPEVYLAREIGACYAGIHIVVNYAEGIVAPWQHKELAEIYYNGASILGKILFTALRRLEIEQKCGCPDLRKETLLKGVYS